MELIYKKTRKRLKYRNIVGNVKGNIQAGRKGDINIGNHAFDS